MAYRYEKNVHDYINSLDPVHAKIIKQVRDFILENLPEGYVENINYGMLSYEIPLEKHLQKSPFPMLPWHRRNIMYPSILWRYIKMRNSWKT